MSVFAYNGISSVAHLGTGEWRSIFDPMERFSDRYVDHLMSHEQFVRDYEWPIDPIHNFTRLWEYPYIFSNLCRHLPGGNNEAKAVLDIGSALTFLPSFLTAEGYRVVASDRNAKYAERWQGLCSELLPPELELIREVEYRTVDCMDMATLSDEAFDGVVCLSVLEHVADPAKALAEFHRVLKPGGMLFLTLDLQYPSAVPEPEALSVERFRHLAGALEAHFEEAQAQRTTHPLEVLTYSNHPMALSCRAKSLRTPLAQKLRPVQSLPRRVISHLYRRLSGRLAVTDQWCAYGGAYRRRE